MSYATILVHLLVGQKNAAVLAAAGELARRHDARLVGIAATQPLPVMDSGFYDNSLSVAILHEEMAKQTVEAEAEFRSAFAGAKHPLGWRSTWTCMALADYIADEARCADVIVTTPAHRQDFNSARHVNIGELILHAGCPVIVVPQSTPKPAFERIVIAWKDSREARRAVRDAIPLLRLATAVTIVEIAAENEVDTARARAEDVADWLAGHGIKSQAQAAPSIGDEATALEAMFHLANADLIVAGAYGHSRMREWAFGGVTRSILGGARCAMLSH